MNKEIEKILVDIVQHCLNLPDNYGTTKNGDIIPCVMIANQNIRLFNTDKMQITIQTISSRDYSSRNEYIEENNKYYECQYLNQSRMMQIDVYSRNNDARQRYWEVITALNSAYSDEKQQQYGFKLGTITSAKNTSGLDGGSDINRYTITFNALIQLSKKTEINYYNEFPLEVYTEKGKIYESLQEGV